MTEKSFRALEVSQRDFTFYLAVIPAVDMLPLYAALRSEDVRPRPDFDDETGAEFVEAMEMSKFAREVRRIQLDTYGEDEPFQRLIDERRIKDIGRYLLEESALLPNPVILAARDTTTVEVEGRAPVVNITLRWDEGKPANIIDGQHRLEALRRLIEQGGDDFKNFNVPFTLLVDFPFYMQAEMFAIINGRQKPVNRSRIYDLLGYMPLSPDYREKAYQGEMAVHRFCHYAVKVFNESKNSPWQSRIKMRGSGQGIVTQAAFVNHLVPLVIPRKEKPLMSTLPIFYPYFKKDDLVGLSKVCILYFRGVRKAWPGIWHDDDLMKKTLFGKTIGVAVMLTVLQALAVLLGGEDKITDRDVADFWAKVPANRIHHPPPSGGKALQDRLYNDIMSVMVGENFLERINDRSQSIRKRLRADGGLYG
jgi:DGQHR domain-containing protein